MKQINIRNIYNLIRCVYDRVITINMSELEPALNGPFTPDLRNALGGEIREAKKKNNWKIKVSASLIGSCTNSSYEDMSHVHHW